jgi:WXG100 family type VII secretion target
VHIVGGYAVDPTELRQADAVLAAAADQSRAALGIVRSCAAQLLGTGWLGPAASAFRLGWQQWDDGAAAMLDALDEMALALSASGDGYASTDEAVRVGVAGASV